MPAINTAIDVFMTYKFLRILTRKWEDMDAYKLGIIDDEGNILKKRKDLSTSEERNAYTLFDRLVWKLKRLLGRLPGGKSTIASYAAALWLVKEQASRMHMANPDVLEEAFVEFVRKQYNTDLVSETPVPNNTKPPMAGTYNILGENIRFIGDDTPVVGRCLGIDLYEVYIDNKREIIPHEDIIYNN